MNNREKRNMSSSEQPEKPEDMEGMESMGTPPEMNCDDEENCEVPEMPEGMDGEMPTDMQGGGMRGDFTVQDASSTADATLHPAAYLGIGAGSVVLGILISYACFSKFFHLKPGQTFSTLSKFIWFIVVALVLAFGICTLGYFIPVWCS